MKVRLDEIIEKTFAGEWGSDDVDNNGIPVLRTTNFTNDGTVNYSDVVTRKITKENINHKFLKKGDILIEKSGGSNKQPVGRVVYFVGEENKFLFNNFTGLIRVKNYDKWSSEYIFYSLFVNYLNGSTKKFENKTTGLHNLKLDSYLKSVEITERSLKEQQAIVNVLNHLNKIIQKRKKQLKKLDELVKSRFIEMFGTLNNPKYKFKKDILKNLCVKITDGKHGGCTFVSGTGRYFIGAKEIYNGIVHYESAPEIDIREFEKDYKRCNIEKGDLLIVNTGATIGKSAIAVHEKTKYTLLQKSVALIKTKPDILNSIFLMYCYKINTSMYMVSGASAQANLLLSKINNTEIYVPNISLQNKFADFVKQTDKSKLEIQKSLDKLEILKKSLMQQYFG